MISIEFQYIYKLFHFEMDLATPSRRQISRWGKKSYSVTECKLLPLAT
uniref:Uncharacterized protein n=1 Tax=Planktothrix pseudagardhii TaxID=132604 RepID=A0A9W4D8P2_9CYAN|nr:hypothetical protein NO713_04717 [Planktothrix pseudagardhii]